MFLKADKIVKLDRIYSLSFFVRVLSPSKWDRVYNTCCIPCLHLQSQWQKPFLQIMKNTFIAVYRCFFFVTSTQAMQARSVTA